jgi:hypothetical protein
MTAASIELDGVCFLLLLGVRGFDVKSELSNWIKNRSDAAPRSEGGGGESEPRPASFLLLAVPLPLLLCGGDSESGPFSDMEAEEG